MMDCLYMPRAYMAMDSIQTSATLTILLYNACALMIVVKD